MAKLPTEEEVDASHVRGWLCGCTATAEIHPWHPFLPPAGTEIVGRLKPDEAKSIENT
jgi:hypothetical protein